MSLDACDAEHYPHFGIERLYANIEVPLTRLDVSGTFLIPMSRKVHCYLRTLRRKWALTQEEVASLLPRGDRNRVRCVELGQAPPNAEEILAYCLIFGSEGPAVFPAFYEQVEETAIQGAYELHRQLEGDTSPKALRKREFLSGMLARAAAANRNRI